MTLTVETAELMIQLARNHEPIPRLLYRHWDTANTLLYVGSIGPWSDLRRRHIEHINDSRWWPYLTRVTWEVATTPGFEDEMLAIRNEAPIFNSAHRPKSIVDRLEHAYVKTHAHLARPLPARVTGRRERIAQLNAELVRVGVPLETTGPSD